MCGICGYLGGDEGAEALGPMLDALRPRGPDDEGRFTADGVALGMRRLAVLDLEGGRQPMTDPITGTVIVYNGEIYNYRELHRELEGMGHRFHTTGDTEVVLAAYRAFGEAFVERLDGMFALALWEPGPHRLLLVRDHLGQKPLYYWQASRQLVFASDLRALRSHPAVPADVERKALAAYLLHRHVPGPATIYRGVRHLPPGSLLTLDENGIRERRYWRPSFRPDPRLDLDGAVESFLEVWPRVVERHLVADVPVGTFLSGGLDSSLVTAAAVRIAPGLQAYSVGFEPADLDESLQAAAVAGALGCRHHVLPFREAGLELMLDAYRQAFDQPFADPALFPTLMLAREARRDVTVVLTGDGGDELFAGYQRYPNTLTTRRLATLPALLRQVGAGVLARLARWWPVDHRRRRWLDAAARRLALVEQDVGREYLRQFLAFDETVATELIGTVVEAGRATLVAEADLLPEMLRFDLETWLPDQMLTKVDRSTMAASLEARLPLLDREVVELALTIPPVIHLQRGGLKQVLRAAAARLLPQVPLQRGKRGLVVPVDRWLRDESECTTALLEDGIDRCGELIQPGPVWQLWREHRLGEANHGGQLFTLLAFFAWHGA